MSDNALGEFLRARREQVRPEDVGLPGGGRRRVAGLRREELAALSGVSAAYYRRLEQGHDRNPSASVLDAVAAVLRLDRDAVEHLRALAHAPHSRAGVSPERVLPDLVRLLDNQVDAPAFVIGARMDVLAANALARVLHPTFTPGRNVVRDAFLDDGAQAGYVDLEQVQRACVSALRAAVAQLARDTALTALVGELTLNSPSFARLWARHEVHPKGVGSKRFRHPALGTVELDQMVFDVGGTDGQRLIVYHAEPASPDGRALALLGPLAGEHEAALAPHGSA